MALTKIKIESFKDAECTQPLPDGTVEAYINPDNYTKTIEIKYAETKTVNDSSPTVIFTGIEKESLTLGKIIVDGTGVVQNAQKITDVSSYVQKFQNVVSEYVGEIHGVPYLRISWATLSFICVCSKFEVKYTLFKPDGNPLRAEITLGLINTTDFSTKEKKAGKNSPDLTHKVIFREGDNLPLLCYRIYGDSSYYLDVARKNNLSNVFAVSPGTALYFYPLKK